MTHLNFEWKGTYSFMLIILLAMITALFPHWFSREEGDKIELPKAETLNNLFSSRDWKTYTVKEGDQKFKGALCAYLTPVLVANYQGAVRFDSSDYVFPEEYTYVENGDTLFDMDWYDYNKLRGYYGWLSRPNRNSTMIAWHWGDKPYTFDLVVYHNDRNGNFEWSDEVTIAAGEVGEYYMTYLNDYAGYKLIGSDTTINYVHPWKKPRVLSIIHPWIGGDNNSKGPYGGVAPKDLSIDIDLLTY